MRNDKKTAYCRESYEAPKCEVIEMQSEGLLSGSDYSATADHQGFEDGDELDW